MKNASLLCDFSTDAAFLRCAEKERTRCWAVRTPSDGLQLRSALRRAVLLQFRRRRVARCAKAAETPFATWAALHSDLAHLPSQRRPSCRPVSPILKHAFGGFAPPLAALAPVRAVPTQSNRQPLSALNPSQTCTRKGGANPKATRGTLRKGRRNALCNMGGFAFRSRPSSGATPPILPPGIAHTETRVWRIRAAACRPCTRKGGANPKQPPTSLRPKPLPNLHPQGWCQPQSNAWHPPA